MEQYISKSVLVAEINRVLNSYDPNEITSGRYALVSLRNFLDTLEVKEIGVDLGDPKGDVEVKTAWTDLEEVAIKYGNCFEKHSDLASMAFIKGANWGKEQAEIQIKAQSMALPHGCLNKEPVSEDLEKAATKYARKQLSNPDYPTYNDEYEMECAFEAGAQWQKEKACEWLKENKDHPLIGCEDPCLSGYLTDGFIEDFKKAMEE